MEDDMPGVSYLQDMHFFCFLRCLFLYVSPCMHFRKMCTLFLFFFFFIQKDYLLLADYLHELKWEVFHDKGFIHHINTNLMMRSSSC